MIQSINNIAILTSGGDSPGMNACIRAITKTAWKNSIQVYGVQDGYSGLIDNNLFKIEEKHIENIIHKGGTFLGTARSKLFFDIEHRSTAIKNLKSKNIEALIVIGGDGSFKGASLLQKESNINIIGIPGTIDNDMFGTDATIGYDTALNTIINAIDKIKDTANSHKRLFLIEVMGKDAGFIALRSAIASGSGMVLIPEEKPLYENIFKHLKNKQNKANIIIIAEGDDGGGANEVANKIKEEFPDYDSRVSILGHIQRGGSPSAFDRVLASRLGNGAIHALLEQQSDIMVGILNNKLEYTPISKSVKHHKKIKKELLSLINEIS